MAKKWPAKDPNEVLDYLVRWANRMAAGDEISTVDFSVAEGSVALAVGKPATFDVAAHTATVWLSGGTDGETCKVLCRITTTAGRTMDQTALLLIRTK